MTGKYTDAASALVHEHGMKVHIDGARIFNAAVALNVSAKELVRSADSVTFCLSKGLCAPVGSVLCGDEVFIQRARKLRKMLGGGMRQAGILAAAGIVALEQMTERLSEDHRHARELAEGLSRLPGIRFDMGMPQTNMVFPSLADFVNLTAVEVGQQLAKDGIKVDVVNQNLFRLVTHYWISDADVLKTLQSFGKIFQN